MNVLGFIPCTFSFRSGSQTHAHSFSSQTPSGNGCLGAATSFADITSDLSIQNALASIYSSVDEIELWIGGLAEDHVNGGLVGELFNAIIADRFLQLRDGDRFFYLNDAYLLSTISDVDSTRLSDIIRQNSTITTIQDNAFIVAKGVPEPSAVISLLLLGFLGAISRQFGKRQYSIKRNNL